MNTALYLSLQDFTSEIALFLQTNFQDTFAALYSTTLDEDWYGNVVRSRLRTVLFIIRIIDLCFNFLAEFSSVTITDTFSYAEKAVGGI